MKLPRFRQVIACLIALWAIGLGLRFIVAYFSREIYYYNSGIVTQGIPELDLIFDWGMLFFLGIIIYIYTMTDVYRYFKGGGRKRQQS